MAVSIKKRLAGRGGVVQLRRKATPIKTGGFHEASFLTVTHPVKLPTAILPVHVGRAQEILREARALSQVLLHGDSEDDRSAVS